MSMRVTVSSKGQIVIPAEVRKRYDIKPMSYRISGVFTLPDDMPEGESILALAILDPAGMVPSARFAIQNYYTGGRHPIGLLGAGKAPSQSTLDAG